MRTIEKNYTIAAPIEKVWDALVNPETIEKWGGGPAKMRDTENFNFSLWGGDIFGKNTMVLASSIYILKSKPYDNSSGKLSSQQDSQQKAIAPTDATVAVDYSASFAIFTNGTFRIFTDSKYHNLSPDVFMDTQLQSQLKQIPPTQ